MYLIFKSVADNQLGIVKRFGHYLDYVIGYLDDSVKDIVEISHLKATVIDNENVAKAWKFAGNYSGYLTVKANTAANEQLDYIVNSLEPDEYKTKYYLTDDDKINATKFMQLAMRKILDDVYDKRLREINLPASQLEESSWSQQRAEAEAYTSDIQSDTPLLSILAETRGITVAEMAQKVLSAISSYNTQLANLLSSKQAIEKEIKECIDIASCNVLMHNRFGYNMPAKQQQDLGVSESSKFDL